MFRSNEALQAKTGLGFRAAEERAHVHFLGGRPDAELSAALSPADLDALLDEILLTKGDDRETWSAGIEYADACIRRKIRVIGRNLDALYDSLCELHGCEIIVIHTDALEVLGSYGERLLECLEDVYEDTGLDIRFRAD